MKILKKLPIFIPIIIIQIYLTNYIFKQKIGINYMDLDINTMLKIFETNTMANYNLKTIIYTAIINITINILFMITFLISIMKSKFDLSRLLIGFTLYEIFSLSTIYIGRIFSNFSNFNFILMILFSMCKLYLLILNYYFQISNFKLKQLIKFSAIAYRDVFRKVFRFVYATIISLIILFTAINVFPIQKGLTIIMSSIIFSSTLITIYKLLFYNILFELSLSFLLYKFIKNNN